jgi:hypothetical protein
VNSAVVEMWHCELGSENTKIVNSIIVQTSTFSNDRY